MLQTWAHFTASRRRSSDDSSAVELTAIMSYIYQDRSTADMMNVMAELHWRREDRDDTDNAAQAKPGSGPSDEEDRQQGSKDLEAVNKAASHRPSSPFYVGPDDVQGMSDLTMLSTFFSLLAASVLVKSIDQSSSSLGAVVNAMLFSAVLCSTAAAVYAVVAAGKGRRTV